MTLAGILPSQLLREAERTGALSACRPIEKDQFQPASLDLRLGRRAWRVRASFLPRPGSAVAERIARYAMHEIDLSGGAVLERGCVYIVELMERVALDANTAAAANPKSSTGRLDVFARLIADDVPEFDRLPGGYAGRLYVEVAPRTFSILVREGARLVQLRLRRGAQAGDDPALRSLHARDALVDREAVIDDGLVLTVDMEGAGGVIAWKARAHAGLVDVERIRHYDPEEFWEPVAARPGRGIVLNPDDFYILASKEAVSIPPDHAAEMRPYDTRVGEFRVHYAGFFDPGFGYGTRSRAVLEVRAHDVPFVVEDGQPVGRLVYERMLERPDKLYGDSIGSNYSGSEVPGQIAFSLYGGSIGSTYHEQGLRLGKQFRERGSG